MGRSCPGRCRLVAGLLAAAAALASPWLSLQLQPSLSAWRLPVALAGGGAGKLSYGAVVLALLLASLASVARSRGRPTTLTATVGCVLLVLAGYIVVSTRLLGGHTELLVLDDANQAAIIDAQITIDPNYALPASFFGASFDPATTALLDDLRAGWVFLLAAGLALAGPRAAWSSLVARTGRARRTGRRAAGALVQPLLALAGVSVLLASVAIGWAAQLARVSGIGAEAAGQPALAISKLQEAVALAPGLADDASLELALGQAQADLGQPTALAQYAMASRPDTAGTSPLQQLSELQQAIAALPDGSPAKAVASAEYDDRLAAWIAGKQPDKPLDAALAQSSSAPVAYAVGHFFFESGDYTRAIAAMQDVVADTGNSEVRSWAMTYIALSELRLGHEGAFRSAIVTAFRDDKQHSDAYADQLSAGLLLPGSP
jgi:hypothetical protein